MKRRGGFLLGIPVLAGLLTMFTPPLTATAACSNTGSFGAVTLNMPPLPESDRHVLWLRLQADEPQSGLLIEINGDECLSFQATGLQADVWQWYAFGGNNSPDELQLPSLNGNTLKLIGTQAGVRIDTLLLARPDCKPDGFGDSCQGSSSQQLDLADQPVILPPPFDQAVKGRVWPSPTPLEKQAAVAELSYSENGRLLQYFDRAEQLDTTLLENGKHTITIVTTLQDGSVIREQTIIQTDNPQHVLSGIIRWVRLHAELSWTIAVIIGAGGLCTAGFLLLKRRHIARRHRTFHGF